MFQEKINQFITKHPIFSINEIRQYIKVPVEKRAVFNTELSRIERRGTIKRLSHGIYVVPTTSYFGLILPNEYIIAKYVYIDGYNGYTTGPTFLNEIGISTWLPRKTHIKTNRLQNNVPLKTFEIEKSRVHITEQNIKYLQFLDGLNDLEKYAVDVQKPRKKIWNYAVKSKLDIPTLLLLCHRCYNKSTQEELYNILEECYETS